MWKALKGRFHLRCRLPLLAVPLALLVSTTTSPLFAQAKVSDVLEVQVLLDRAGHSPGVIDGKSGGNTSRAIKAFERSSGLAVDGKLDPEVMKQLRGGSTEPLLADYRIEQADVDSLVDVPDSMEAQAKLAHLGFEIAREALAEKFHMSQGLLSRINPAADWKPGETIRVVRPGTHELGGKVARIEVDKAQSELRAMDAAGKVLASYPATIGSERFPSPNGRMQVRAIAPAPKYYFDPAGREWGPDKRLTIAAGPNNPVGGT
jgi:peptidoglycan hydrolase-like protein with peptidoglycan-binding domain